MAFYIDRDSEPLEDPDSANYLPTVPEELLVRHGARVLRPSDAGPVVGEAPRPTVYRSATLLIPDNIYRDSATRGFLNEVLANLNLQLEGPELGETYRGNDYSASHKGDHPGNDDPDNDNPDNDDPRPAPPVLVVLRPLDPTRIAVVDAWVVLQRIRDAAASDDQRRALVAQISVEHLMFSAVEIEGTPWDSNSAPASSASYVHSPGGGPVPVSVVVVPAEQTSRNREWFDRRPVVAVLDTGIGTHPWFDLSGSRNVEDRYVRVLDDVQDAIKTSGVASGSVPILDNHWDVPSYGNPLRGEVERGVGHGTFIAGIIRQAAPDAQVGVARVMHSDGVAYEGDVLAALWQLVERVRTAQTSGSADQMVDIVSLSFGYHDEQSEYTPKLAEVIGQLTDLGVLVVAAAGNNATARPFFPAALSSLPGGDAEPVLSVGALNPNGTKAWFSNQGKWVHAWATGASVVSTFPVDVRGAWNPELTVATLDRAPVDPDDFRSGFAVSHGTSFAAPLAAAYLANGLIAAAKAKPKRLRLGDVRVASMRERARRAVRQWTRVPDQPAS
jgi:Subtilase family